VESAQGDDYPGGIAIEEPERSAANHALLEIRWYKDSIKDLQQKLANNALYLDSLFVKKWQRRSDLERPGIFSELPMRRPLKDGR